MSFPPIRTPSRAVLLLPAILALLAGSPGCKKNKKKKSGGTTKVTYNWKKRWDKITADGEEGKFLVRQGLGTIRDAGGDAERLDRGYNMMVKGINKLMAAMKRGEALLDKVHDKEPGRSFPEWEETLSDWGMQASKARKTLPLEYIDQIDK